MESADTNFEGLILNCYTGFGETKEIITCTFGEVDELAFTVFPPPPFSSLPPFVHGLIFLFACFGWLCVTVALCFY